MHRQQLGHLRAALSSFSANSEASRMPVPKAPLELYGYNTIPRHPEAIAAEHHEICPFLGSTCWKTRKSNPAQSIGTCVVGSGGVPQIICPTRLVATNQIFEDTRHLLTAGAGEYFAVPEVTVPDFGNVDFAVIRWTDQVEDFYGLEIQTLDTTGSVWQGRQDFYADNLGEGYKYGINWKMTAKLVLIQTSHKAPVFESWGKKFVWVMQNTLLTYMMDAFDFSDFRDEHPDDHVLFYGYELDPGPDRYGMRLERRISGDLDAVARAMGAGASIGEDLLADTVAVIVRRNDYWRPLA